MKIYVIIVLSLWIFSLIIRVVEHKQNEDDEDMVYNFIGFLISIVALIFTCIGWN